MNPQPTLLQRIQEGLPLPVRLEGEQAVVEDGEGRCTHFPLCPSENSPLEGSYDATLEVTHHGRFLDAKEIGTRPLKAWLGCKETSVRLVVNRNPVGEPLDSVPFTLDGIEVVVRPTLNRSAGERAWRLASLLPCREVRLYSPAGEQSWRVFTRVHDRLYSLEMNRNETPQPPIHDRFNAMAAALPSHPMARPYGTRLLGTRKQKEDWKGFQMKKQSS